MNFKLETVSCSLYVDIMAEYGFVLKDFHPQEYRNKSINSKWVGLKVTVNNLEELATLQKRLKHPIILSGDTLEIYEWYRE